VALYVLKLLAYSAVAAAPVLLLRQPLAEAFGGSRSNLVAYGVPFALSALAFGAVGVALLAATKDRAAGFLVSSVAGRSKRRSN